MADWMNQCSNTSSVSSVLQCDDLLTEILIRLPPKSIFKLKCVSRTWKRVISDPNFRCRFKSRRKETFLPLLGFFQSTTHLRRSIHKEQWAPQLSFLSTSKEGRFMNSHSFIKKLGFFIGGSSEGLILCGRHPVTYYVCNPITNQWLSLPKPNMQCDELAVGFSCKEPSNDNGLVCFTVIRANVRTGSLVHIYNTLPIETLSSETGEWKESLLTSPSIFRLVPYSICQVVGGVIYWRALEGMDHEIVAAYDPNMKENCLRLIRFPSKGLNKGIAGAMGQSSDGLLQCTIADTFGFEVWVLRKKLSCYSFLDVIPSSEWFKRSGVGYKRLNLINFSPVGRNSMVRYFEKYPSVIAFHPQNSQLVYLRLGCKIFCYDLETRILKLVQYHGTAYPCYIYNLFPYFQSSWPPSLPPLL